MAEQEEEEAAEPAAPPLQREAEGLRLHLSSSSSTGYQSVYKLPSGRFALSPSGPLAAQSPRLFLGSFGTAVEAAAAYARAVGEPPAASEFEGVRLHLSSSSSTGYEGVRRHASGKFVATRYEHGRQVHVGLYDTAVEAARAAASGEGEGEGEATFDASPVAEAEGLRLHLSSSNSTGYRGVYTSGGRFMAQRMVNKAEGLRLHLSSNNTTGYKGVFRQSKSHRFEAKRREGMAGAEAEGLRLHLSSSSSTGYKSVYKLPSGRFALSPSGPLAAQSPRLFLGSFGTAVEAAAAYARAVGEPPAASEFEGVRLHLSSSSSTGYEGVRRHASGKFVATRYEHGRQVHVGLYDTAVEAARAAASGEGEGEGEATFDASPVAEAEGLRLHLSSSNSTGYRGVYTSGGRFMAQRMVNKEEGVDPKWIKDRIEDCHPARAAQAATVGTVVAPTAQAVAAGEASVPSSAIQVGPVPAAPPRRAPLAAEAEGLRLHLSSNNTTGYKGVFRQSKSHRFEAKRRVGKSGGARKLKTDGKSSTGYLGVFRREDCGRLKFVAQVSLHDGHRMRLTYLGVFPTAVKAAVAVAKAKLRSSSGGPSAAVQVGPVPTAPPRRAPLVAEAEGLRLHVSSRNNNTTGYNGVVKDGSRFKAQDRRGGKAVSLGTFDTAVEAAVAYARAVGQAPAQGSAAAGSEALDSDEGEGEDEEGEARCLWRPYEPPEGPPPKRRSTVAPSCGLPANDESAPFHAPPAEAAVVLCGNTHECNGGAFGCILPAGHGGPHDLTLPAKRARCAKRPFDPANVEAAAALGSQGRLQSPELGAAEAALLAKLLAVAARLKDEGSPEATVHVDGQWAVHWRPRATQATFAGDYYAFRLAEPARHYRSRVELVKALEAELIPDPCCLASDLSRSCSAGEVMAPSVGCDAGGCSRWACLACAGFRSEAEAGRKTWFCTLHAPAVAVVAEAEGLRLHLSSISSTGYRGVSHPSSGRFQARHNLGGKDVSLGCFGSAVEAAVAYARALLPDGRTVHKEAPPDNGGMAAVADALGRIGLQSYAAAFDSEGFDDIDFLLGLDRAERAAVATATGMDAKPGHAGKWVRFGFGVP
ncbi:hypothetical protein EMIHUDRAFT_451545 [Emiliania huxleyi CCMP1516]|uniref:AP2/ERF domain-containing protein n=2 Tax=Emiliania huxleyi TaxID=2903 RepID=A0A0D3IYN7_EMIH1|nr:hypothetical protein EMIHUDRAFT_451545 [Emiliania huxleyi CCMP1516]EOD16372.1 hypothetical protein EMIHUDRAFT_451545 [Emiliania huxleyi CCMP1516]|eukprot:XP_005768801.1 hypothetical protein EMIHUDRAFT_451545 [Emiliania huxleyi CCMP1516]